MGDQRTGVHTGEAAGEVARDATRQTDDEARFIARVSCCGVPRVQHRGAEDIGHHGHLYPDSGHADHDGSDHRYDVLYRDHAQAQPTGRRMVWQTDRV